MILSNGEDVSVDQIQSYFVTFLEGVLEESSENYRFDFSHLDSNGLISVFNDTKSLGTEYLIQMDGVAYYKDEGPSIDALAQSLNVYFSFWGAADLEDYLGSVKFENAEVISVSIDGEPVSFVSSTKREEENQEQNVAPVYENIFYNDEGELSKPVVISIYSSVVAVAVIVALIVFRHRIGKRRLARKAETQTDETGSDGGGDVENGKSKIIEATETSPTIREVRAQKIQVTNSGKMKSRTSKTSNRKPVTSTDDHPSPNHFTTERNKNTNTDEGHDESTTQDEVSRPLQDNPVKKEEGSSDEAETDKNESNSTRPV